MPPVLLDSLEIEGYRLFERLSIPQLGRVNLITGKNNAGKSTLLEALRLYNHRGSIWAIWEILSARGETIRSSDPNGEMAADWRRFGFQNLFHGRSESIDAAKPIRIGPEGEQERRLSIAFNWYVLEPDEEAGAVRRVAVEPDDFDATSDLRPGLAIQIGSEMRSVLIDAEPRIMRSRISRPEMMGQPSCIAVSANGLSALRLGELWDNIALTDLEDEVLGRIRRKGAKVGKYRSLWHEET